MLTRVTALLGNQFHRSLLIALGVLIVGVGGYVFVTNRPISVTVARVEQDVAIRVFGLRTVEARVPSAGTLELDGDRVFDGGWLRSDLRRLRLDKIGFIFQAHNLIPFLDATDNVALVLQLAGADADTARRRAVELLDYLEVGHRKNAMPAKLSGGEAQRVAIARALANRPRIILADEPTAALDSKRAGIVMDLLRKVAVDQNAAIIAVTHDEKIFDRFDTIFNLRDGRLDQEPTAT